MAKELAVILNDGSIDAAVTTALASQKHRIALVHTVADDAIAPRRRAAFDAQAGHFTAQKIWIIPLTGLQPEIKPEESLPRTLLSLLPSIALTIQAAVRWDASSIYLPLRTGSSADDLARGSEFTQIFTELLQLPCARENVEILTPLLELEPWQVIDLASQIDAPLQFTWSCQTPGLTPCNLCPFCKAREAAFLRAVKPDPLRSDKR
jgi:7-cyano-7-deazaguanine synthase